MGPTGEDGKTIETGEEGGGGKHVRGEGGAGGLDESRQREEEGGGGLEGSVLVY